MSTIFPGDAEASAAITALNDQTPAGWRFQIGQTVRVPRTFADGYQTGTIIRRSTDRRVGTVYDVDTPQGRQRYLPDEMEVVS
jgi:hypothetical protein